jgi:hypothetical protein
VTLFRGVGKPFDGGVGLDRPANPAVEEKRRAMRSGVLATGTLACRRCDAPIDPGAGALLLTESLTCPFCDARGPARDFLSLGAPTRPARVVLRVALRTH